MKKARLIAMFAAMTLGVKAGDWGKQPVYEPKEVIEECVDLGASISAGYMTDYIFYGRRLARDSVWTDLNYTFDTAIPINVGAWYLNGIGPGPVDELDLYASAEVFSAGALSASLGYVHYFVPESNGATNSYGEIGLDIAIALGFVDLAAETNYALSFGWYHQVGIEKSFALTDAASLVLGTGIGYSDNYFAQGTGLSDNSGWNHYYISASLPIELNCRTVVTPYIGYNGSPDGFVTDGSQGMSGDDQSDILHGGVSISVSF